MPGRYRNFCFTVNNFTDADKAQLAALEYNYLCYGHEVCPDTGTPHLQGYCELQKQMRHNTLKLAIPRAHFENRKGTPKQAADYAKKDGVDIFEDGIMSRPGARTDIKSYVTAVREGKNNHDLIDDHLDCVAKYRHLADFVRLSQLEQDRSFEPLNVIVLWGAAGTGKTKTAHTADPLLFQAPIDGKWWDGYTGQKTILFDDFYGKVPYDYLLKLLDGYKFHIPIKGGFTWKCWKTVYITSNHHPEAWYPSGLTPALARRISGITEFHQAEGGAPVLPPTSETSSF